MILVSEAFFAEADFEAVVNVGEGDSDGLVQGQGCEFLGFVDGSGVVGDGAGSVELDLGGVGVLVFAELDDDGAASVLEGEGEGELEVGAYRLIVAVGAVVGDEVLGATFEPLLVEIEGLEVLGAGEIVSSQLLIDSPGGLVGGGWLQWLGPGGIAVPAARGGVGLIVAFENGYPEDILYVVGFVGDVIVYIDVAVDDFDFFAGPTDEAFDIGALGPGGLHRVFKDDDVPGFRFDDLVQVL